MQRRSFLKAAAISGLALSAPVFSRDADAASPFAGPYWIMVNASGGWDPRFLFDPSSNAEQNRLTTTIQKIGNISYAPIPVDVAALNLSATEEPYLMSTEDFLNKFGSQLCVINGVDTSTNNHDAGNRTMWCGRIPEGYPALGALIAGARAPQKPMAFLSSGGYDSTQNVVALTRVNSAGTLRKIAYPNVINANDLAGDRYHTDETLARIAQAQAERLQKLSADMRLPRVRLGMDQLHLARLSENELQDLQLPDTPVDLPGNLGDLERLMQQAQIAIAAFKSGLAAAANVSIGGFDTHANHDTSQRRQIQKLLSGINYIMDEVQAQGLAGKVYVVVCSDFGRTPRYNGTNAGAGKDHWSITSMMAMGPGIQGNRVIGATGDADQKPYNVDPGSLATLDNAKDGVRIRPEHIHRALRSVATIADSEVAQSFPLPGEDLSLFG
ncbi:MAG: DUF1501 domain-containing protein [Polyangiaceae bacterium]